MTKDAEDPETVVRLIAHDLRNPLTAVQLNAQLLERAASREGHEKELRWAGFIINAARRMDRLFQLLIEAERLRSGRIKLALECLPVGGWLGGWLPDAPLGFERSRLSVALSDASVPALVDARRLQSVMLTLMDVAGQQAEGQAVRLEVHADGGRLRCAIRVARSQAAGSDASATITAGHDIEIHYVRAVLAGHGGDLAIIGSEGDAVGFDVIVPVADASSAPPT